MDIDLPFFTDGTRPATATQRHHQDPEEHPDVDPHHVAQVSPHHPVTNLVEGALAEVAGLSELVNYTSMFDTDTDQTGADILTNNFTGDKPPPTTTPPPTTILKEQEVVEVQTNAITITIIKGEVSRRNKPETTEKLGTNTILKYFAKATPVRGDGLVQEEEHPHVHWKPLLSHPGTAPHNRLKNVCLQKSTLGNAQPLRAPSRRNRNKKKTTDQNQPSISKYFKKQADTGSGFTTTQFMGEKRKREEEFSNFIGVKKLKLTTTKKFLKGKPWHNTDYRESEVQPDKTKRPAGTR